MGAGGWKVNPKIEHVEWNIAGSDYISTQYPMMSKSNLKLPTYGEARGKEVRDGSVCVETREELSHGGLFLFNYPISWCC